jgi:hypothetical protein
MTETPGPRPGMRVPSTQLVPLATKKQASR